MIRIYIGGEGRNELGSWAAEEAYQSDEYPGAIQALLGRVRRDGWRIEGGMMWKNIRKLKVNTPGRAEVRNILGLVLKAKENGCLAVAFIRDQDGSNEKMNKQRERDVEEGIRQAIESNQNGPAVIGGVAVKKLESWIAALRGVGDSENMRRPEEFLSTIGIGKKDTAGMVRVIESAEMEEIPRDARSLRMWLNRAREALEQ